MLTCDVMKRALLHALRYSRDLSQIFHTMAFPIGSVLELGFVDKIRTHSRILMNLGRNDPDRWDIF